MTLKKIQRTHARFRPITRVALSQITLSLGDLKLIASALDGNSWFRVSLALDHWDEVADRYRTSTRLGRQVKGPDAPSLFDDLVKGRDALATLARH